MSLGELVAVANGARIQLSDEAVDRIEAARQVVDGALSRTELVYGLNTGLGHARNDPLPADSLGTLQRVLVAMHDGTMGALLPTEVVRAAMASRLNGISRGGSGATVASARTLEAMLNAGVHPLVGATGSVGAADLGEMAAIAMVALGFGRAELDGEEMTGAEALSVAGIPPLSPEPKEGLALVSASGMTVGHGALVMERAAAVIDAADLVAAVSLEALPGNPSILDARVANAKGSQGQVESSARIRSLIEGSSRSKSPDVSVQDALAFRVIPQVHGAARDMLTSAADAVIAELNSMSDNPLVAVEDDRIISNGNFHPMLVALQIDALRPALAHVGQIADRRFGHLWDGFLDEALHVDREHITKPPPKEAGMLLRYATAARYTRLRQLANPVTLDIPALDFGIEDHATNAPEAVGRTAESIEVLEDILAAELLVAYQRLDELETTPAQLGQGTAPVVAALSDLLEELPDGSPARSVHQETRRALTKRLLSAAPI